MYRIVIMYESAREIVHKVNYDEKIVNLKRFGWDKSKKVDAPIIGKSVLWF